MRLARSASMRSVWAPASLLLLNLFLIDRDSSNEVELEVELHATNEVEVHATAIASEPTPCAVVDFDGLRGNERRLADLWHARHACEPLPTCNYPDPIAVLDADVDGADGREHVIGNRRFGVAMYAANNDLIATMEPVGCRGWPVEVAGDQSLSLGTLRALDRSHPQLVIRTRTVAHCGEFLDATITEHLEPIAKIDLQGERGCNIWESQIHARIAVPHPGELVVHYHGRVHRTNPKSDEFEYLPWERVDEHCTFLVDDDGKFRPVHDESITRCYDLTD